MHTRGWFLALSGMFEKEEGDWLSSIRLKIIWGSDLPQCPYSLEPGLISANLRLHKWSLPMTLYLHSQRQQRRHLVLGAGISPPELLQLFLSAPDKTGDLTGFQKIKTLFSAISICISPEVMRSNSLLLQFLTWGLPFSPHLGKSSLTSIFVPALEFLQGWC